MAEDAKDGDEDANEDLSDDLYDAVPSADDCIGERVWCMIILC
jgi:hypothetical protein